MASRLEPSTPPGARLGGQIAEAARGARSYLASEQGRRLRRQVAAVVIVGAPIVAELPVWRRTPLARFIRMAGVVTLVVKGAEWLRDWEPDLSTEIAGS
jgi:hypothetical protein